MSGNEQTGLTASDRAELRAGVKSIRAEWRERLSLASRLSPSSKLAAKASVLLLGMDSLDDRITEAGGEDELVFVICAQVASGVTLTDWCGHYMLERGLVWAFLSETPERMGRYERALRGIADAYVSDVVGIADSADPENVPGEKLRIDARLKVAGYYDKTRFGRDSDTSSGGTLSTLPANIQITFVAAENGRPVGSAVVSEQ